MGSVAPIISSRWRSRRLAGDARHQLIVRVRKGSLVRAYSRFEPLYGHAPKLPIIWKGNNTTPWSATWEPAGDWITVPEVESAKFSKSFSANNGISTLTVVADNIAFLAKTGTAGVYHEISRGYFSPQRGYKVGHRPELFGKTPWKDVLNGGYQIELWEGYGPDGDPSVIPLETPITQTIDGISQLSCLPPNPAISRTYVGLIDSCELDTHPDMMTITARDFGKALTDQRMIYHNKAPEIPSPVIFADRRQVLGEAEAAYNASASGYQDGFTPAGVLPTPADGSGWVSQARNSNQDKVYLTVQLHAGAYEQFFMATPTPGLEAWVAIYATPGTTWNGKEVSGWIDAGNGSVTYSEGGTSITAPWVNNIGTVRRGGARYNLNGQLQAAEGTQLHVFFSNLNNNQFDPNTGNKQRTPGYVASVHRLWGYRYGTSANVPDVIATGLGSTTKAEGWVLIDDVADIVRMVLTWAGFKEWTVQDFGWSLAQPFNFGQDKYFMDVITSVMNQADWLFHMKAPTDHDLSIGVPSFRQQSAVTTRQPSVALAVKDTDLLEALTASYDNSTLPYSFRVRGKIYNGGTTFGQDLSKRYMGTYFPPWCGLDYRKSSPTTEVTSIHLEDQRLSGINRNYVATQGQTISLSLNSTAECLWAAVLTAIQYALNANSARMQIAGLPSNVSAANHDGERGQIELNNCVSVVDEGTATNSRIWISSIESDHSMGEGGSWHMTISGSLLDYEDMQYLSEDWAYAVFKYSMERGAT